MNLSDKTLEIAISQIGKKERPLGSNWGEPVKDYLASVGIGFPASWCMAFIYWCHKNAAECLNISNPAIRTGGVLKAWNDSPKEKKSLVPIKGSVFIMDFGKGLGHAGIVESFDSEFIYTIEGNTNDTGTREGVEVCRKKRKRNTIKGYLKY